MVFNFLPVCKRSTLVQIETTALNPFPSKPWFLMCLQYKSFENTVGKGEIARNKQFLDFPQCFYLFGEHSAIFIKLKIVVCKVFENV